MTDNPGNPAYGTADHARMVTFGRHPGVQTAMAWLAFSHLPDPLKSLCSPLYEAACFLLKRIPNDSAELATAMNSLVSTKDWYVRAGIRSDEGRPGPVPRPATVVGPPVIVCPGDLSCRPELPCQAKVHWWTVDPGAYQDAETRRRPIKDNPQA